MSILICKVFSIVFLEVNVGPFAPLVGYIGALIGTVFTISLLVWGKGQVWNTPSDVLPKNVSRIVAIATGVAVVLLWLDATPDNLSRFGRMAIVFGVVAVVAYLLYYFFVHRFTYTKVIASGDKKILGGVVLKKKAKERKRQLNIPTQDLFAGAAYDVNWLWSEISLGLSKILLIVLFLFVMTCGMLAISTAGFMIQVRLTGKPAAAVIKKTEAPGLEDIESNKENTDPPK